MAVVFTPPPATPESAPAAEKLLTAEEYLRLPADGRLTELVRGRVVEMSRPNFRHGIVCSRVDRLVGGFAEQHDLGQVTAKDSGIITRRDPDSVRGADVAFYSYQRLPKGTVVEGYPTVAPDLVFEVRSPNDTWPQMLAKAAEYLAAGVQTVCILDPEQQSATVIGEGKADTLRPEQELRFPELLPGFGVVVGRLFS